MSMVVKNNIDALRTVNLLDQNNSMLQKSLSKVATGMKINSAQDDAAPWSISERMRMRIRALEQANQNVQNDSALMKTAEGAVSNTIEILKALKEKAINAANDSNTDEDRQTIQKEVNQFIDQVDDNALVQFNGKYLIDGTRNNAISSTATVLLNQSLATDITNGTKLTDYKDRSGNSLGIQSTDYWQVSWVTNGVTSVASGVVKAGGYDLFRTDRDETLTKPFQPDYSVTHTNADGTSSVSDVRDRIGQTVKTPDGTAGLIIYANTKAQSGNGTVGVGTDRALAGFTVCILDKEGNIKKSATAALNDFKILQRAENKTGDKSLTFHTGPEANVAIKVGMGDMRAHALGLKGTDGSKVSVTTKENANAAINVFDNALQMTLDQQVTIGSVLSRLDYTSSNIITARDNDQESESVIRDADMAKEMTNYTKANVLMQTAQAMLAQANQNSNAVLSLLQ